MALIEMDFANGGGGTLDLEDSFALLNRSGYIISKDVTINTGKSYVVVAITRNSSIVDTTLSQAWFVKGGVVTPLTANNYIYNCTVNGSILTVTPNESSISATYSTCVYIITN